MSTITFVPAIGQYADAVRAALTGLDYRQVQDLTDGLEMDLTDALADDPAAPGADGASSEGADEDRPDGARLTFDRLVERFGDPGVYADELRVSAGLPGRAGQAASGSETVELEVQTAAQPEAPARRSLAEIWAVVGDKWGDKRWWRLGAWLVPVLRPVWWVARGAALGVFVSWRAGYYQVAALVATGLAGVAASLALAKVDWSAKSRALRVLMAVTNTVLAFLLVVTVLTVGAATEAGMVAEEPYVYEQGGSDSACGWEGICVNGELVSNIYAFDAEGNPIDGVQLFDDSGRPIELPRDSDVEFMYPGLGSEIRFAYEAPNGDLYTVVPARTANGDSVWNVFPLAVHQWRMDQSTGEWEQVDEGERAAVPPFPGRVPGLDQDSLPGATEAEAPADQSADAEGAESGADPAQ